MTDLGNFGGPKLFQRESLIAPSKRDHGGKPGRRQSLGFDGQPNMGGSAREACLTRKNLFEIIEATLVGWCG